MPTGSELRQGKRGQLRWQGLGLVGAAAVGLLIVSGCQSLNDSRAKPGGDPLFGEKAVDRPPIGPTPPPQNRAGMVPSPPTSTAAKSNTQALLESLPNGKAPLSIGDTNQQTTQTAAGWQPKDGQPTVTVTGATGGPGVQIKTPEAVPIPPVSLPAINTLQPVPTVPVNPVAPSAANDTDQLLAQLKARGMVWNTQQPIAGGVRFSCGIASSQNPNAIEAYEATAADYRSAISAVLQKLNP
jgi:hypothetical protein